MKTVNLTQFSFHSTPDGAEVRFSYREPGSEKDLEVSVGDLIEWSIQGVFPATIPVEVALSQDDPLLMHYGPWALLYCHSPLPDPHRFFLEFTRLLNFEMDIPRPPATYLNMPDGWPGWLPLVYSRSYLLARGPREVIQRAAELVERQAVEFMILDDAESPSAADGDRAIAPAARAALRIDKSWVISSRDFERG